MWRDASETLLYPRDPSLDPQLVWKGKDEQDRADLAVPVVPVYIQESIEPRAIVENVRTEARHGEPEQPGLFETFDGLPFDQRIEFYQHEQRWTNRMILGDSLLVMTSLTEKEGLKGAGFDVLVICGFAFDAHAGETAKEFSPEPAMRAEGFIAEETRHYGKLPVLLARMNPDLAMGDDQLKKTGAGNLFTVFGEPDLVVDRLADGRLVVEIRGVDVYDPTTGEVRSSSTDDIACWFIDTAYNDEAFVVRHAYFTGADQPYERLKRALRAEIDGAAWSALYATVSRPFERPETGRIAVKVINHYGDEVLKVVGV